MTLSDQTPRAFETIVVTDTAGNTALEVKDALGKSFQVPFVKKIDRAQAHIWFTNPGEYVLSTDKTHESLLLFVKSQMFLPFKIEFGVFMMIYVLVMGGLWLWIRKIKHNKRAASSI